MIEAIKSFLKTGSFIFESDLILKDLKRNNKKKFKIDKYFDTCPGRKIAKWDWKTDGKIIEKTAIVNGESIKYFQVEFDYSPNIVESIRKIPGRRYNADGRFWTVPYTQKEQLFEFAISHKFSISLTNGNHYSNNTHLINFIRDEVPNGINYCEGRKSKIKHRTINKEFWWCVNQECFENATTDHLKEFETDSSDKEVWEYYTFLDILNILEINTDETNHMGDYIPNGKYYKFIGHINAFNRLLEKLYCNECGDLLYPTHIAHFALYLDTHFHCENNSCSQYKRKIYLNHCLNGECTNIIDSRISKKCPNNLYICDSCGTCCSTDMFRRRLNNLRLNDGYIHPELIFNVENEKGHLEKAEYYCYKCQGMMTEHNKKLYVCDNCGTKYDFEKFKWLDRKWTNKHKRRNDYPSAPL